MYVGVDMGSGARPGRELVRDNKSPGLLRTKR